MCSNHKDGTDKSIEKELVRALAVIAAAVTLQHVSATQTVTDLATEYMEWITGEEAPD